MKYKKTDSGYNDGKTKRLVLDFIQTLLIKVMQIAAKKEATLENL